MAGRNDPSGKFTPISISRKTAATTIRKGTAPTIINFEDRSLERRRQLIFSPTSSAESTYRAPDFLGNESSPLVTDRHDP
jgi:hypothetical protein